MVRLLLLVVPLAALAGCKTENAAFCANPANAGIQGCPGDASGSSGSACGSDGDCNMPGLPACDKAIAGGTCKACTASDKGACGATTPRCEADTCVACVDDVQDCGGGVCLDTGGCAAPDHIIHVSVASGQTTGCGDTANPCSLAGALALASPAKNVIKLDDASTYTVAGGFTVSSDVTIDARGSTLTQPGDMVPVITVMPGKSLTLLGGTVQGGKGPMGSGIVCGNAATVTLDQTTITTNSQSGISATGCVLTVTRARIEGNMNTGIVVSGGSITMSHSWLDTNAGGGIDVNSGAQFTIVGNVLVNNGIASGNIGGINILTNATNNRFEFNSISENKAQMLATAGISCSANLGFVARNNIIYGNNSAVPANGGIQVSGPCGHTYSDIGPAGITGGIDMGHNQNVDPGFKDKTKDLHLTAASVPAMQQSDPSADLTGIAAKDIDGDLRTPPVDIGADQYHP